MYSGNGEVHSRVFTCLLGRRLPRSAQGIQGGVLPVLLTQMCRLSALQVDETLFESRRKQPWAHLLMLERGVEYKEFAMPRFGAQEPLFNTSFMILIIVHEHCHSAKKKKRGMLSEASEIVQWVVCLPYM